MAMRYLKSNQDLQTLRSQVISAGVGSVTGLEASEKTLKEKALDVATLIRRFNIREGMVPQDDRRPKFFHQPLEDNGQVITEAEMEILLKDYYRLHGWDANGVSPKPD
jgi:aldehyde:ferredoxin oxidoreductase